MSDWRADARCACCGRGHDPATHATKLILDHIDRRGPNPDAVQVLCVSCNSKKGSRQYIPFPDGVRWYPGMPPLKGVRP